MKIIVSVNRPLLGIILILLSFQIYAQNDPPPPAMPATNNVKLIDDIIKITRHEQYFKEYCSEKVNAYAKKSHWSTGKTNEILGSIKFDYYSMTIYNSYAFYETDELESLLKALKFISLNPRSNEMFVLTNSMMQHNLDNFVEGLIEGKYVTKH